VKKYISLIFILYFILFFTNKIQSQSIESKYGVSILSGAGISASGVFHTGAKVGDMVKLGKSITAGVYIDVSNKYCVEMLLGFMWMYYKDEYKPDNSKNPAFSISFASFNNNYNFINGKTDLFFILGLGIYNWKFTENGLFGDAQQFEGEDLSKMSIGLNSGFGIKFNIKEDIELTSRMKYHYILSKDQFFFGDKFTEQGIVTIDFGIKYNFRMKF